MEHALNVNVAKQYDIDTALFLQNLKHWTLKNLANKHNIRDGLCWSYDSLDALCDIFPYWTRRQIERIIRNCLEFGLIKKGNYNITSYDRTCWYALTEKSYWFFPELADEKYLKSLYASISPNGEINPSTISPIGEIDFTEFRNRFPRSVTTIPITNPDTDPNTLKTTTVEKSSNEQLNNSEKVTKKKPFALSVKEMLSVNINFIPQELIEEWITYRKKPITQRVWNQTNQVLTQLKNIHGIKSEKAFERMLEKQWQGIEVSYFQDMFTGSKQNNSNYQNKKYTLEEVMGA